MSGSSSAAAEIPDIVTDPKRPDRRFKKGKFLGKGGFARCFEMTDLSTNRVYAGKIIPKTLLQKQHQKEKMRQEIEIHRNIYNKNIVKFYSSFDDENFVYILLELCSRRSLMELHKRRRAVTEPEARYFFKQITEAVKYLHDNNIIHRDLKLGNLFLNDNMDIKIGDFGLATRYDGERKMTLCGTPNYIAPEVLCKTGHSFEVDAWSMGCILYTLLVGKPPFETSNLKETYNRIKKNIYQIPRSKVSPTATSLIQKLLNSDPLKRPSMADVLVDPFFESGYMPLGLPISCLTMTPRFDQLAERKPLSNTLAKSIKVGATEEKLPKVEQVAQSDSVDYLQELYAALTNLTNITNVKDSGLNGNYEDSEDPAAVPIYWVSKWVDYSDKYGLGYQLCDNSVGVLFNDSSRLILAGNGENMQYIERTGQEHFHTLKCYPENLQKKMTLLRYFRNYMTEHLLKAGPSQIPREGDEMTRLPFMKSWFRTRSAMVLQLSNGTVQVNFFQDHTKVIICPIMQAVSFIDDKRNFRTFRFSLIEQFGCPKDLLSRLKYARAMLENLGNPSSR